MSRLVRLLVPRALRVELVRLRRWPSWWLEHGQMAGRPAAPAEAAFVLARHASPLRRSAAPRGAAAEALQAGKERNVGLAAAALDGVRVAPHQVFSYLHRVGRTTRARGFRPGLELRDGRPATGVGGGCCQVSNLVYYLALCAGMNIVERHRHSLDLFPDDARRVPFGCGATVFYNYADLRFVNPLPVPVTLHLAIAGGELRGELRAPADPGYRFEVYEVGHRFFVEDGATWRENRIRRRVTRAEGGALLLDQEVAHNRARVLYPVAEASDVPARRAS